VSSGDSVNDGVRVGLSDQVRVHARRSQPGVIGGDHGEAVLEQPAQLSDGAGVVTKVSGE
jgi:hypothetical protein